MHESFSGFVTGALTTLPPRLAQHEALLEPVAGPAELDEPAVVYDAVDDRGSQPVVSEHRAPPAELDIGGEYDAPPLVALGDHLIEKPRPVHVEGRVAELIQDEEPCVNGNLEASSRDCGGDPGPRKGCTENRMYSAEQRRLAIETFIRFDHSYAGTVAELVCPTRPSLRAWYKDYLEHGEVRRMHRNGAPRSRIAFHEAKKECFPYASLPSLGGSFLCPPGGSAIGDGGGSTQIVAKHQTPT